MTSAMIRAAVNQIFRDIFDDENILLSNETTANDIDGWDSLSHISLIVAIEKEFKVKFDLADLKKLRSVGDLFETITRKLRIMNAYTE